MEMAAARWVKVAVLLVLVAMAAVAVEGKVVEETLVVGFIKAAPDCFVKTIFGINGSYPGPTIRAQQGDTLKIKFINHLPTEGFTMHWHGIRQVSYTSHTSTRRK